MNKSVAGTGERGYSALNIFLTLLFWIPGVIHTILVVNSHLADKRIDKIVKGKGLLQRLVMDCPLTKTGPNFGKQTNIIKKFKNSLKFHYI